WKTGGKRLLVPLQTGGIEDRAIDADAFVVPAVGRLHARDATEARAEPAGHRGLQRDIARRLPTPGQVHKRMQHRPRPPADQRRSPGAAEGGGGGGGSEKRRQEAGKANAPVTAGKRDRNPGGGEVFAARSKVGRTHPIVKQHPLSLPPRRSPAVAAAAQEVAG